MYKIIIVIFTIIFIICVIDTSVVDIEEAFRGFVKRNDIAIIMINQNVSTNNINVLTPVHDMKL